jgi:ribosomal protein S27E
MSNDELYDEPSRRTRCWNCGATATTSVGWRSLCTDCSHYFTE